MSPVRRGEEEADLEKLGTGRDSTIVAGDSQALLHDRRCDQGSEGARSSRERMPFVRCLRWRMPASRQSGCVVVWPCGESTSTLRGLGPIRGPGYVSCCAASPSQRRLASNMESLEILGLIHLHFHGTTVGCSDRRPGSSRSLVYVLAGPSPT